MVRNHSFLLDNRFSSKIVMIKQQPRVAKSVIRLSEGCQKVVGGDLLDHFSLMRNFLPESCQDKMFSVHGLNGEESKNYAF